MTEPMKWKFDEKKVKGAMAEMGMNQNDVANEIGLAMPTVNLKLNGKREFTASEICRLASALDKSPSYFFAPQLNPSLREGDAN